MPVLFVIDPFHIDTEEAVIAEIQPQAIEQLRFRINQHLKSDDNGMLRIRFNNLALFNRFSYFEGLEGVLPTQRLIPRSVYKERVNKVLPGWLTDDLIIQLDLLKPQTRENLGSELIDQVIMACDPNLVSDDFVVFAQSVTAQPKAFWQLLKITDVQTYFIRYLKRAFDFPEDVAQLFIERLLESNSAIDFFTLLAYEQHQELLRQRFTSLQLGIPLPARSLPTLLLNTPLLELAEGQAKELPEKCLNALEEVCRQVEKGQLEARDITSLIIAEWPSVLTELQDRIKSDVRLNSNELIIQLKSFNNQEARQLASKLAEQLELTKLGPLTDDATTSEVLNWSKGYFEFVRQQFLSNQAMNESLNLSFSEWLLSQSARIARSPSDWRQFSERVERFLEQGYLVVVCMVDALSALNQDLLLESAAKVEHLLVASETLFAPLPTLTEIGKMALITGKETCNLPSAQETAIRQRFQDYLPDEESLKFVKSWKSAPEHINEKTNLVVFLENRIDERLHDCIDFEKHRKDVSLVLRQMMSSIDNWKKDAGYFNRDIVFLITADHGMTVTQTDYQGKALGETKERVFKVPPSYTKEHEDFALVSPGGRYAYLMAKKRVRLADDALLTHGGLTPEEVLIPFVTLSSRLAESIKTPLELTLLSDKCQRLKEKSWQISVELNANVAVNNITIKLVEPLLGEETVFAIAENGSQRILLSFSSQNEQSGVIELVVQLSYDREGAHEVNTKSFPCVFPEPLIKKDATTQGFEDMF